MYYQVKLPADSLVKGRGKKALIVNAERNHTNITLVPVEGAALHIELFTEEAEDLLRQLTDELDAVFDGDETNG